MATSYILGLSAYYHDSAACLLRDGEIVAAGQEERERLEVQHRVYRPFADRTATLPTSVPKSWVRRI